MVVTTSKAQIDSIHVIGKNVSLKLKPSTCENPLANKQTLCLAICITINTIIFDLEDPFATHWFATKWERSKYPSFIIL